MRQTLHLGASTGTPEEPDLFPIYPIENQSVVKLTDLMDKLQ